jgi:hypothetical protein
LSKIQGLTILGRDKKPIRGNKIFGYLEKFGAIMQESIVKLDNVRGYSLDEVEITVDVGGSAIIFTAEGSITLKYRKLERVSKEE